MLHPIRTPPSWRQRTSSFRRSAWTASGSPRTVPPARPPRESSRKRELRREPSWSPESTWFRRRLCWWPRWTPRRGRKPAAAFLWNPPGGGRWLRRPETCRRQNCEDRRKCGGGVRCLAAYYLWIEWFLFCCLSRKFHFLSLYKWYKWIWEVKKTKNEVIISKILFYKFCRMKRNIVEWGNFIENS